MIRESNIPDDDLDLAMKANNDNGIELDLFLISVDNNFDVNFISYKIQLNF